ncbi:hypothetical protein ABZP36_026883 [Zizania latifolia]
MVPDPAILRATAVPSASAAAAAITGRGRRTGRTAVVQRLNPLNIDDIIKNPGSKTTFEVGMLADNSWKKFNSSKGNGRRNISGDMNKSRVNVTSMADQKPKQLDHNSDSDSEEDMVEGLLTISDTKENYKIPSQADLIRQAFAGDDVEAKFEKDKMEILNEENPEPEKPALVPGWGQWTDIQQKKDFLLGW